MVAPFPYSLSTYNRNSLSLEAYLPRNSSLAKAAAIFIITIYQVRQILVLKTIFSDKICLSQRLSLKTLLKLTDACGIGLDELAGSARR